MILEVLDRLPKLFGHGQLASNPQNFLKFFIWIEILKFVKENFYAPKFLNSLFTRLQFLKFQGRPSKA